jgi:hypothetical protein
MFPLRYPASFPGETFELLSKILTNTDELVKEDVMDMTDIADMSNRLVTTERALIN